MDGLQRIVGSDWSASNCPSRALGSVSGGRRVWVLARLPEYVYVANNYDGSMAVTAAVTPIRIVCANTLGAALRQAEHGVNAQRTFRLRHTGNLQAKFAEARQVLGMTINYQKQFKELADRMAAEPIATWTLERRVLRNLWTIDEDMGKVARANRERTIERGLSIFRGRGRVGDTTGNSPRTKWVAFNAIAEHLDYGRLYTSRTNQVQRSFEDTALKQRVLDVVLAA
jgi:Domain of unknown function (DUF932)